MQVLTEPVLKVPSAQVAELMAKVKVANHKYICPECKGNGYNKVYDMIVQCDKCKSEGELRLEEPTLEELNAMATSARLQ